MIRAAGLVLLLFVTIIRPLEAAPIPVPGQDAPAFVEALEDWLADDEEAALPVLARLAQEGNAAAQLLLALIDKTPELQGPWLSRQPRDVRVDMMRDKGGMSGRSWIHAAADAVPLAAHWQTLWTVDAPMSLIVDFAVLGEDLAARVAVSTLAVRERQGFSALADEPGYPAALRVYLWREWTEQPDQLARLTSEIVALAPGDPQRKIMGERVAPDAYMNWLMAAPEAGSAAAFCTARCGETTPTCALAAAEALQDPIALMLLGSPSEALIPNAEFVASPRGEATLLRSMLLRASHRMRAAMFAKAAKTDACFAELLTQEATRY